MPELNANRLAELTIEALERTAFVVAEIAEADIEPQLPEATRFTRIDYSGPASGHVYLAASDQFIRELAASLLGVEPEEIVEDQCTDALRELTNLVGGSVTLELGGTDRCLSLGLPASIEKSAFPAAGNHTERCCLDSEGQRLEVIWVKTAQSAAAAA